MTATNSIQNLFTFQMDGKSLNSDIFEFKIINKNLINFFKQILPPSRPDALLSRQIEDLIIPSKFFIKRYALVTLAERLDSPNFETEKKEYKKWGLIKSAIVVALFAAGALGIIFTLGNPLAFAITLSATGTIGGIAQALLLTDYIASIWDNKDFSLAKRITLVTIGVLQGAPFVVAYQAIAGKLPIELMFRKDKSELEAAHLIIQQDLNDLFACYSYCKKNPDSLNKPENSLIKEYWKQFEEKFDALLQTP